jgi:SAM-dependent methyltransferase
MDAIERSRRAYRRRHRRYEQRHGEIFNPVEQERLRGALTRAAAAIRSGGRRALDFGCGTGNLTEHLVALGFETVAADVSPEFLRTVGARFAGRPVQTLALNGRDLAGVPDAAFDLVATYSVLHHVPDYLAVVRELQRVLRPGGVLVIDHEASAGLWADGDALAAFGAAAVRDERPRLRFLRPSYLAPFGRYYYTQLRRRRDPRYEPEGDIHVWHDDHIEWSRVEAALAGCETVIAEDYLLYRREYDRSAWERHRHELHDTHLHIARKR